jgi:anti-anti-sigma factor
MQTGRLEISVDRKNVDGGSVALVRAGGEVDLSNAEQLADALLAELPVEDAGVVLDIREVPFMDSSGLRVLLVAVREAGARLVVLARPGSPVVRLFELAEVSDRIRVSPTEEEAIDAVRAAGSGDRD